MEIYDEFRIGDVVQMRKVHPCGGDTWEIVRVGADIGMVCTTCGRRVMLPRRKFARQAKRFVTRGPQTARQAERDGSVPNVEPGPASDSTSSTNKGKE